TWSDAVANSLWTAGVRPDDVVAHLADQPAAAGGWPYADGLRRLGATVAWLGGRTPEQVLAQLPPLRAAAVMAGPSTALELAEEAAALGATPALGVRKLLAGTEPGLDRPEVRGRIAEGWGVTHVRDTMGLAEVMAGMWSECGEAGGMHFNAGKYVIAELVE